MRIALAALLAPLAAHAHPGHPASSEGFGHWVAQHSPELAGVAIVLAASVAAVRVYRARALRKR